MNIRIIPNTLPGTEPDSSPDSRVEMSLIQTVVIQRVETDLIRAL